LLLSRCPLQPHEKYHDATIQTWSEHLWLQHVAPCDLEKTRVGSISASWKRNLEASQGLTETFHRSQARLRLKAVKATKSCFFVI
jgi:hypothetical protein